MEKRYFVAIIEEEYMGPMGLISNKYLIHIVKSPLQILGSTNVVYESLKGEKCYIFDESNNLVMSNEEKNGCPDGYKIKMKFKRNFVSLLRYWQDVLEKSEFVKKDNIDKLEIITTLIKNDTIIIGSAITDLISNLFVLPNKEQINILFAEGFIEHAWNLLGIKIIEKVK